MNLNTSLQFITAVARSGSLDHAWQLFEKAGLDKVDTDADVLCVLGRLTKDRALAASGDERRRLYLESAAAYDRASRINGRCYPLINAATLSLLAGRKRQSRDLARKALELAPRDTDETDYYRAATGAEALLLLGQKPQARKALAGAIAALPCAYEDRASTLRQFTLILDALGEDKSWLDALRAPRCVHFAGLMALAAKGGTLPGRIAGVIAKERIGFGFGALAAGADIVIAEALHEAGAELHIVLPARVEAFREVSVARFGRDWAQRFDRMVGVAQSVRSVADCPDHASPMAIRFAAEIAMGRAAMLADMYMTEAVQLLILDTKRSGNRAASGSDWIGAAWKKAGRRQHILAAPRAGAPAPEPADTPRCCIAAMLRIDLSDAGRLARALPRTARALMAGPAPLIAPRWTGDAVLAAYETAQDAARATLSAAEALGGKAHIAGHYAIVERMADGFGGEFLAGPAASIPRQIAARMPPRGAIQLTEDFAAALRAGSEAGELQTALAGEFETDEIADPIPLYSLKR